MTKDQLEEHFQELFSNETSNDTLWGSFMPMLDKFLNEATPQGDLVQRQNEKIGSLVIENQKLNDWYYKNQSWIAEAKEDAGFNRNESFDVVWAKCLEAYKKLSSH